MAKSLFLLQGLFNRLVSLTEEARKAYKDMVSALEQEQAEEALKNDKKVPHHMGHSRNHSAASAISFCSIFSEPISEVNEKEYGKLISGSLLFIFIIVYVEIRNILLE